MRNQPASSPPSDASSADPSNVATAPASSGGDSDRHLADGRPDAPVRQSALWVLYLTVFIDLLGFGLIIPALPYYAEHFGANAVWVGALLTAYSAAQFFGSPLLGRTSDRVGRRPVLMVSLAGSAASLALSGLASNLYMLIAARALAGLFGGSIATAQAYIADVTAPRDRARYLGLLGASIGLGFVFGPGLSALIAHLVSHENAFRVAAFVAAGLAALNLAFAAWKLPESRRPGGRAGAGAGHTGVRLSPLQLLAVARRPQLGRMLAATFLATFGFVSMEATFALLGERRYGFDQARLGAVFTYLGLVMIFVQGGMVGRLTRRYGERHLAVAGALISGLFLLGLPFAPDVWAALAMLGLLAVGQALGNPTLSALVSKAAAADEQGGTLGAAQSMAALARAVGPLVAGALFAWQVTAPYVCAAVCAAGAAVLVLSTRSPAAATSGSGLSGRASGQPGTEAAGARPEPLEP